ncbi:MAG: 2-dehydro-3-deoxygalactonokinase [Amaricoccus sp.]|uniref:2-dehydro-3-deoxygalactonokinase n=1 Tax=Amaricoccus sp. TaxID=1872485 RepID=UPI0039E5E881
MTPDWIAVDWGSSNLRAWAMDADSRPRAETSAPTGASTLAPGAFEAALLAAIGPWLGDRKSTRPTDVIVCGMAGARGAWVEAPYAAVPCPPSPASPARVATADPRLAVRILPGLSQLDPADVMRGEETQIAGLLAREPRFDGVACLPGTHTKWAHLSAGEVVSFASYMTGEIFALLATQSVLRRTVAPDGWDEAAFLAAAEEGLARPERVPARLFGLRAGALVASLDPTLARARLSGLLIGAEIAAARPYWLGRDVVLIGAPAIAGAYRGALGLAGLDARVADATAMTLAGLAAAHAAIAVRAASNGAHP